MHGGLIVPIYEYLCRDCAYKFELKQSMKDEPVAACTRCGKTVSRIISPPAIMFKGSGWYVTDYSDKLKPPAGESSGSASSPKNDSTDSASATTPAPAPATAPAPSTTASGNATGTSSSSSGTPSSGSGSSTT